MRVEWNAAQSAASERSGSLTVLEELRQQMHTMADEMQRSYDASVNALQDAALQALLTTPRESLLLADCKEPLGELSFRV